MPEKSRDAKPVLSKLPSTWEMLEIKTTHDCFQEKSGCRETKSKRTFQGSVLKRKQGSASTPPQVAQDDKDDAMKEEEWLQQVDKCMINYQSSIQYTMIHTMFVIYVRHRSSVHLTLKCWNPFAGILKFLLSRGIENTSWSKNWQQWSSSVPVGRVKVVEPITKLSSG